MSVSHGLTLRSANHCTVRMVNVRGPVRRCSCSACRWEVHFVGLCDTDYINKWGEFCRILSKFLQFFWQIRSFKITGNFRPGIENASSSGNSDRDGLRSG